MAQNELQFTAARMIALGAIGFFAALVWDIQWHNNVGPDSFFTGPHALLYTSVALTGLVSLYTVLNARYRLRRVAPRGFMIAGLGASAFIISGLCDLYWHTMYGFDVTLLSPPHFGLLLSGPIIMVGALYAIAIDVNRVRAEGRSRVHPAMVSSALMVALLLGQFSIFLGIPLYQIPTLGPIDMYALLSAVIFPFGLLAAASFLRWPAGATLTALLFMLLRLGTVWFGPWAVSIQAQFMGYAYREGAVKFSIVGEAMPSLLLFVGIFVDLLLLAARRLNLSVQAAVWVTAAGAGLIQYLIDPTSYPSIPMLIVVPLAAALSGRFGWNIGSMLRFEVSMPEREEEPCIG
jgi:hypothetical protein